MYSPPWQRRQKDELGVRETGILMRRTAREIAKMMMVERFMFFIDYPILLALLAAFALDLFQQSLSHLGREIRKKGSSFLRNNLGIAGSDFNRVAFPVPGQIVGAIVLPVACIGSLPVHGRYYRVSVVAIRQCLFDFATGLLF